MADLKAAMKKHNISIDSTSSTSHGHALSASRFSFNATSTSHGASYHMAKDKAKFSTLKNVTPRKYLLVMIYLLVL
jgi:hypothetical protein